MTTDNLTYLLKKADNKIICMCIRDNIVMVVYYMLDMGNFFLNNIIKICIFLRKFIQTHTRKNQSKKKKNRKKGH